MLFNNEFAKLHSFYELAKFFHFNFIKKHYTLFITNFRVTVPFAV